jgi:hypothetical protein
MVLEVGDTGKMEHLHFDRAACRYNSTPESSKTESAFSASTYRYIKGVMPHSHVSPKSFAREICASVTAHRGFRSKRKQIPTV